MVIFFKFMVKDDNYGELRCGKCQTEMGSFFFSRNGKMGKQADFHVFIEPGIGMLVTIERGHDKIVIDLRFIGKTIDRFP